jgi:hypothetical protein
VFVIHGASSHCFHQQKMLLVVVACFESHFEINGQEDVGLHMVHFVVESHHSAANICGLVAAAASSHSVSHLANHSTSRFATHFVTHFATTHFVTHDFAITHFVTHFATIHFATQDLQVVDAQPAVVMVGVATLHCHLQAGCNAHDLVAVKHFDCEEVCVEKLAVVAGEAQQCATRLGHLQLAVVVDE